MGDVRVVVRFRPQQERELLEGGEEVCIFEKTGKGVSMNGTRKAAFTFDRVFNKDSTQEMVYNDAARPVVEDVLKGYNGTIFAYGQTSSGKTFTMEGADLDSEMRGIIPRIVQEIFGYIEIAPESYEFIVKISYFEIYMEKIRDLLCDGNENLQIHESKDKGVYVRHATELYMQSPEDCLEVMRQGAARRMVAETNMNDQSSRSHGVVLLELTQKDTEKGGSKTSKLYLVDLAGSEKVSKTGADGMTLEEAKTINRSLSALGLVIMTLTDSNAKTHIPYRDSKLTRILQESLGGNARTTIICCCSPSSHNEDESLSTLNFAKRAKKIKNCAKINQQYSAAELQKKLDEAKKEIKKLVKRLVDYEQELNIWRSGGTVSEEDRVNIASSSLPESIKSEEQEEKSILGKTAADAELADEERESFMQRESELLDLLDDKDEEIRMLEREIDQLSEEKFTITKLAGENLGQKQQIEKLDQQIADLQSDHELFEGNIEELVNVNEQLITEKDFVEGEKEDLKEKLAAVSRETNAQLQQIGDQIFGLLSIKNGSARQLPTPPNLSSIVTLPLDKAKAFVVKLQEDLKENAGSSEEVTALMKEVEMTKSNLENVEAEKAKLESTISDKEGKIEAMEAQITDLIEKLLEMEQVLDEQGDSQDMSDVQKRLQAEKDALTSQVQTLKSQLDDANKTKHELGVKIKELEGDLKKEAEEFKRLSEQLANAGPAVKEPSPEMLPFLETTNYKLEQFKNLRDKMRAQIMKKKTDVENIPKSKNSFYEEKLSVKKKELTGSKQETRDLKKKVIVLEAESVEMKRRVADKDAKYRRAMHERNQLDAKLKELQQHNPRASAKVVPRRRAANATQQQSNRGVRGGGQRRASDGRSWQQITDSQQNERRRSVGPGVANVVVPEENPDTVEYV